MERSLRMYVHANDRPSPLEGEGRVGVLASQEGAFRGALSHSAAMMRISTLTSGRASLLSTQARAGVWPWGTQASQTLFI